MNENAIKEALSSLIKGDIIVQKTPNPSLGDLSVPCFAFSKELKNPPQKIAEDLSQKLQGLAGFEKIKNEGPYINFTIDKSLLAKNVLVKILAEKEDFAKTKTSKETVVIEYSSPNTNKPLHLGHLRNDALGMALSIILTLTGKKVIKVSIVIDRGVHICKSMLAYLKWKSNETPKSENMKGDHFVGELYVLFSNKAKEDPSLEKEAQELLKKWEAGDKKVISLWKKMRKWVIEGFNETYKSYGSEFDKHYFESEIWKEGKDLVNKGLNEGIFIKDETGVVIAPLEQFNIPNKVLIRSDGTSIYITQDIYLAKLRYDEFKFSQMFYVVASEQNLHFKQLFKILAL